MPVFQKVNIACSLQYYLKDYWFIIKKIKPQLMKKYFITKAFILFSVNF